MKNFKITVFAMILLAGMTSCKKDRDLDIDLSEFSTEEAAEIITNALQNASNGLSEELSDITQHITETIAENYECDVAADSSFTKTIEKVRVTAEYDVKWTWTPTCNDLDNMIALDYGSTMTGGYTGLRSDSKETKSTIFTISGMQLSSAFLIYDGTSLNEGTQTVSVQESKEVKSKLNMTLKAITVDKLGTEISNGDATFTLTATLNNEETFDFNGSIEFLGSKDAILIINGETFEIDL